MQTDMIITLSILLITAALFISGKIRSDLVAISALILLVLFDILTPSEALSGFSNSVVIMMIGLFVVGGGIFQTGLAKKASGKMLQVAGNNETRLLITVMLATSFIGAFVSNTGTVAVMMPIVVSLAMSANISPGRLLMPLAFASSLGGTLTLIGTPPNMVIRETLKNAGFEELSFFSYTPIGLTCLIIGMVLIVLLGKWLLPKEFNTSDNGNRNGRSLKKLVQQYQISQHLYRMQVKEASPMIAQTLAELEIARRFQVHILAIHRKTSTKNPFFNAVNQEIAGPDTVIHANDVLYVYGDRTQIESFARAFVLESLQGHASEADKLQSEHLVSDRIGIAEVLFPPNSRYIHQEVKHSGFRENYNLNILGIQRKGEYILNQLKEEKIRSGDALLVQGTWDDIARLSTDDSDIVVVGQPLEDAASVTLDHKAPIAAGIMLLMVISMIVDIFPAVISVMIAAVLMVATGCLRNMEQAYKTINWESIVLIGGMIPMSIAIENTGLASLVSNKLVASVGSFGPLALLAGVYFSTSLLTLFISNTACAVLFAPIALSAALQIGVNPVPFLFAVSIGATICFAVPFSTPPNALVMSAGRYTFMDYIKLGLPIQLLMGAAMVFLLPLFFPF